MQQLWVGVISADCCHCQVIYGAKPLCWWFGRTIRGDAGRRRKHRLRILEINIEFAEISLRLAWALLQWDVERQLDNVKFRAKFSC